MSRIPFNGNAMDYAKEHLARGIFSVDEQGRIWRHKQLATDGWREVRKRRAENTSACGYYLRLAMSLPGRRTVSVSAHRLVYEVMVGPIPDGSEINHKDLNKQNNAPSNLEAVSPSQNISHSYAHGRPRPWAKRKSEAEAEDDDLPLFARPL